MTQAKAIEFDCPYCQAVMRAAAERSGQAAECPACHRKCRVPAAPEMPVTEQQAPVADLPSPPQATPVVAPASQKLSDATTPVAPQPVVESPPPVSAVDRYLESKRKRGHFAIPSGPWARVGIPVLLGMILVAIGFAYWYGGQPSFQGELTGTRLPKDNVVTTSLEFDGFRVDESVQSDMMSQLREKPVIAESNLVSMRATAGEDQILFALLPGYDTRLVRVSVLRMPALREANAEHAAEWNQRRQASMQRSFDQLSKDWSDQENPRLADFLIAYRERLAYASSVQGLGWFCEAIVQNTKYPCLRQEDDGSLLFMLPTGVQRFTIREVSGHRGPRVFPDDFEIQVSVVDAKS